MPTKVVNVRGTSGSGKSTLVVKILKEMEGTIKLFEGGRRKPIAYRGNFHGKPLVILGHYEIPTGGCDTISKQDHIFGLAERAALDGANVLFEGRLPSVDVKRTVPLSKKTDLLVLHIDLPVDECLAWVNQRRQQKNPDKGPVNPKNTTNIHKQIRRTMDRLRGQDVKVRQGNREEVEAWLREHLG